MVPDAQNKKLALPIGVVSPTDVARLVREINNLDEFFRQAEIRQGGQAQEPPRYSRLMDELVNTNGLNLLQVDHRNYLVGLLKSLADSAPVMHISFSADPPGPYVQKIVSWLRQQISPVLLVSVGLQPNIGAGCIVRTTNRSFDFSLRKFFDDKHDFFIKKLHEAVATDLQKDLELVQQETAQVAAQEPTQQAEMTDQDKVEVAS